jgi:hypothetical protein
LNVILTYLAIGIQFKRTDQFKVKSTMWSLVVSNMPLALTKVTDSGLKL